MTTSSVDCMLRAVAVPAAIWEQVEGVVRVEVISLYSVDCR